MCGSRVRGEELTQDVFVRAWEKLPQFRGESAFSTWIHRVAVNIVLTDRKNEGRARQRMKEDEEDGGEDIFAPAATVPRMPTGWISRQRSRLFRRERDRFSCCTTSKDTSTKRSPSSVGLQQEAARLSFTGHGCY